MLGVTGAESLQGNPRVDGLQIKQKMRSVFTIPAFLSSGAVGTRRRSTKNPENRRRSLEDDTTRPLPPNASSFAVQGASIYHVEPQVHGGGALLWDPAHVSSSCPRCSLLVRPLASTATDASLAGRNSSLSPRRATRTWWAVQRGRRHLL